MHYHNFYFFYSLSFSPFVRAPLSWRRCSVLTFARPCRCVVVLFLRSRARRFFVASRLRYAPLWEFGLASPTLHYHRGRRSSARPPHSPVCTVYTRLQLSGWPTKLRCHAAKVLKHVGWPTPLSRHVTRTRRCNTSTIYRRTYQLIQPSPIQTGRPPPTTHHNPTSTKHPTPSKFTHPLP